VPLGHNFFGLTTFFIFSMHDHVTRQQERLKKERKKERKRQRKKKERKIVTIMSFHPSLLFS
jgi:hypothetical protein